MSKNLFDDASKGFEKKMRQEFADTLLEVGQKDDKLVVLIGDISHFILQPFAKACPGRFYNIGICEPTIVNMCAGLAKTGLYPVVHTINPFIVERSFEQLKLDFGYQKLGVNIITVGGAFDYGALGCTHHSYGDFALLKTIQNMQVTYPASCEEFNALFKQTYDNGLPTFFRIPESQHGVKLTDIKFGKGVLVREGADVTLVALGPQLRTAIDAADMLDKQGVSAEIVYLHTIRPLDVDLLRKSLTKTKACIVIEEHGQYGGVFDDVLRSCNDIAGVKFDAINIGDKFIHEYGSYADHCVRLGFTPENIVKKAKELI